MRKAIEITYNYLVAIPILFRKAKITNTNVNDRGFSVFQRVCISLLHFFEVKYLLQEKAVRTIMRSRLKLSNYLY